MIARWAINRYMRLLPTWLKFLLAGLVVIWIAWSMLFDSSKSGSLMGHSHIDRPIYSFWVDGNWGGNLSAYTGGLYTGGGTTCCWGFQTGSFEVVWILDVTPEDIEAGLEEERHSLTVSMPSYNRQDQYLHVHFLPENQVELAWSPDLKSPLSEKLREED